MDDVRIPMAAVLMLLPPMVVTPFLSYMGAMVFICFWCSGCILRFAFLNFKGALDDYMYSNFGISQWFGFIRRFVINK